jgi:Holliday junction resolvase RusA-like endonuclease
VPITITVHGEPAPKGSKSFKGHAKNGRAILVESSKKEKPWAESCKWAAIETGKSIKGPVAMEVWFTMRKPKSAPKKRVTYPDRKPDLSKLVRSLEDAIVSAGVIQDDACIIQLAAYKVFPNEHEHALHVPGAVITLTEITA